MGKTERNFRLNEPPPVTDSSLSATTTRILSFVLRSNAPRSSLLSDLTKGDTNRPG